MYLTLSADYLAPNLVDPDGADHRAALPSGIRAKVDAWNAAYQPIIPLTRQERAAQRAEIDHLDADGLRLAREIGDALAAKVDYFSEGLLRRLP